MSFILEGLKKSEKKREETAVPNLHTVHDAPTVRGKKPLWPYLLVLVLLLNAGILLWFLAPWTKPSVVPVALPSPAAPAADAPVAVAEVSPLPVAPVADQPVPSPASEVPAVAVLSPEPSALTSAPTAVPPVAEEPVRPEPVAQGSADAPVAGLGEDGAREPWNNARPIYDLVDLPMDVQGRLPEINISFYAYADDPGSRLVRVNSRILREGSYLDVGLLLDEITPAGLVFTFEGYRFWVPKQ